MTLQNYLAVPVTLCRNCKLRKKAGSSVSIVSPVSTVYLCREFPLRKVSDLITNGHHWQGSLESTSPYPFRLCSLVNNGRCKHYKPKLRLAALSWWVLTGGKL